MVSYCEKWFFLYMSLIGQKKSFLWTLSWSMKLHSVLIFFMYRPNHISRMTKEETSDVEEAQPASEIISPAHEPRKKPIVHPSAQAPLPKDYGGFLILAVWSTQIYYREQEEILSYKLLKRGVVVILLAFVINPCIYILHFICFYYSVYLLWSKWSGLHGDSDRPSDHNPRTVRHYPPMGSTSSTQDRHHRQWGTKT